MNRTSVVAAVSVLELRKHSVTMVCFYNIVLDVKPVTDKTYAHTDIFIL